MDDQRQLIITIGLPASGKTFWARALVSTSPPGEVIRVNRDDLRRMLRDRTEPGDRSFEHTVTAMQHAMIRAAWSIGVRTVVCDDTNLNPEHVLELRRVAQSCDTEVVIHDLRGIPLAICLERNAERPDATRVPTEVIRDMHRRWIAPLGV